MKDEKWHPQYVEKSLYAGSIVPDTLSPIAVYDYLNVNEGAMQFLKDKVKFTTNKDLSDQERRDAIRYYLVRMARQNNLYPFDGTIAERYGPRGSRPTFEY